MTILNSHFDFVRVHYLKQIGETMKNKFLSTSITVLFLALLVGVAYGARQTPASSVLAKSLDIMEQSQANGGKLEGTWRVQVTIRNCQTGAEVRTFPSLVTFAQGGTLIEATTGGSPAVRGSGHGFWQHTSGHDYNAVFEAFLFDAAGTWTGRQKVTQTITIGENKDQWSAVAATEFFDTNGNPTMTGCSTAVGQRMVD
jgi:hypothetical protein